MIKYTRLSNLADYSNEKVASNKVSIDKYVTIDCMNQNKGGINISSSLPPTIISLTSYREGDILIGNIRPYLKKIWSATTFGGCSQDVLCIRTKANSCAKFIYYALANDSFFEYAMKGTKGSKMPRGDKDQIMRFYIPEFDLPTQQKIANILSSLDKKIELNNKIIKELEAMSKELYDYWFVQFDFPDSNGKPYRSSGGKMVYNPILKRKIPEGWVVESLLDIASYTNGLACQNNRPNENEKALRVIKIKEMHNGFSNETEFVSAKIPEKVRVYDGDVLFSWSASLEVMIWAGGKGALNQHIFKVISDDYPREYYYFQLLDYIDHFKKIAEARKTTMGHITQEHLQQSRIVVPDEDNTIISFERITKPIIDKIVKLYQEGIELSSLRDWLLPMLMNGQVTIQADTEKETNKKTPIINLSQHQDPKFESWLTNQGLAARGDIDKTTLKEIFDAMDNEDK